MAFEGVFGNVDFMAPVRSGQQDKAQFMQMLGMGIQKQQFEEKMDMERRQMEAKGKEFNLKRTAENALMKQNMGMPLTDKEKASIQTMGQIAPPTFSTDLLGRVVSRPSGWGSVGGTYTGAPVSDAPNWSGARPSDNKIGNTGYGQGSNPAMTSPYDQISPAITMENLMPMDAASVEAQLQGTPVGEQTGIPLQEPTNPMLPPTPNYDNSPLGEIDAGKVKLNLKEYAAKMDIDLSKLNLEQQQKLDYERRLLNMKNESALDMDQKKKIPARQNFERELGKVLETLDDLNKEGGTISEKQGVVKNVGAMLAETPLVGDIAQATFDPKTQTKRNIIEGKRPVLFNSIKKASGLTGTELNSSFEIDNQLKQLGNPKMTYEARKSLLRDLSKTFGTGEIAGSPEKEKQKPTPEQIRAELKRRGL